jgi:hypothetical protein
MKVMKSYYWIGFGVFLMSATLFWGCEKEAVSPQWNADKYMEMEAPQVEMREVEVFAKIYGELTQDEVNSLTTVHEVERLGHEIFGYYSKIWYQKPQMEWMYWREFNHQLAVEYFMQQKQTKVPLVTMGEFTNTEFQAHYDWAMANSQENIYNSITAGAKAIEWSIDYLDGYLMTGSPVVHDGLCNLYTLIRSDAENELRFMVSWAEYFGMEYTPMILDQERFEKIMQTGN